MNTIEKAANSELILKNGLAMLEKKLDTLGLMYSLEDDFWELHNFAQNLPDQKIVNYAYDPRYNHLTADRAFWIKVKEKSGEIVAYIGGKVLNSESVTESIRGFNFWFEIGPPEPWKMNDFQIPTALEDPGKFGYTGRLYTHPNWRGRGISSILPRMARLFMVSKYNVDYNFGIINDDVKAKGLNSRYGSIHQGGYLDFNYKSQMGQKERVRMSIVYMSRSDILNQISLETQNLA